MEKNRESGILPRSSYFPERLGAIIKQKAASLWKGKLLFMLFGDIIPLDLPDIKEHTYLDL